MFESSATNLVPNDTNGSVDVFLFDLENDSIERVSVTSDGTESTDFSGVASVSGDGRFVVFVSSAPNLVPDHPDNLSDIFIYDRETSSLKLVTRGLNGADANDSSGYPTFSANGEFIVFMSWASNLVADDENGITDIFLYNRQSDSIERVSGAINGEADAPSDFSSISGDGRFVVFSSYASNLVPGDTNFSRDVFLYDRISRTIERVSVAENGAQGNGTSAPDGTSPFGNEISGGYPAISADGRLIAFSSYATNFADGDSGQFADVFTFNNQRADGIGSRHIGVHAGQIVPNVDFGMVPDPGTIAGRCFEDLIANSIYDIGETGRSACTIYIDSNNNGRFDQGEVSTESSSDGNFEFTNLESELEYRIGVVVPSGWNLVIPSALENGIWRVYLPAGGTISERDFGLRPASTLGQFENAAIEGRLFADQNGNRIQDLSEAGIAGATLFLDLNDNGVRDFNEPRIISSSDDPNTTNADESGRYAFANLGNRPYTVRVLEAPHFEQTAPVGNSFQRQVYSLAVPGSPLGSPQDVTIADFNGDGWPDLASVIFDRNAVSILLNDQHGGFSQPLIEIPLSPGNRPTTSPRGVGPVALLAGNFNGGGRIDLAVVNTFSANVTILLDFDGLQFTSESYINVGTLPNSLASGDLDGDLDLDLIVANDVANPTGTVRNLSILRNNGLGVFMPDAAPPSAGNNPSAIVTGFFNNDNRLDLAITDFGTNPKGADLGDVRILLSNVDGTFQSSTACGVGFGPSSLVATDFNGDLKSDLAVANFLSDNVTICLGNGDGTFQSVATLAGGSGPMDLVAQDIDKDNDTDLLVTNGKSKKVGIFRNRLSQGGFGFDPAESFGAADFPGSTRISFAAGDLDRNGLVDLAVANSQQNAVTVNLNTVTGGAHRLALTGVENLQAVDFGFQEINFPPTIDEFTNAVVVNEDSGLITLPITGISAGIDETQPLQVTVTTNNPTLFSSIVALYESPSTSGQLRLSPAANRSGSAIVTVKVTDSGLDGDLNTQSDNSSTQKLLTITVHPLNDSPTLDSLPAFYVVDPNATTQTIQLTGITAGPGETQSLRVIASTTNGTWIQNVSLPFSGTESNATLTFTTSGPVGSGQLVVTVTDGGLDNDLSTAGDNLSITQPVAVVTRNDPPSVSLLNTLSALSENAPTSARRKMADIAILDDGVGGQTLDVSGADSQRFEIIGTELFLVSGAVLDFESKPRFNITVSVDDTSVGTSPDATVDFTLDISDDNEPPNVVLLNITAQLTESVDLSARRKVADIVVTDDALGSETLTLAGINAGAFELVGAALFLKAGTAIDFETLAQLSVTVLVDDATIGTTPDGSAILTLSIADANEPPSVVLQNVTTTLAENTSASNRRKVAGVLIIDDALGRLVVTLTGADANRFELVGNELYLRSGVALDFEMQSQFQVTVELDYPELGSTFESSATMTLSLSDVNEIPVLVLTNAITAISEAADTSSRRKVADIAVSDDGLGSETVTLAGINASAFELIGAELFLKAGTSLDFETSAQLTVTVQVDDASIGATPDGTAIQTLSITDANEPPSIFLQNVTTTLAENTSTSNRRKVASVLITDDALGRPVVTLVGADANRFELVGNELFLRSGVALDFETQSQFQVTVELDDPELGSTFESSATMTLGLSDINEIPVLVLTNAITSISEAADTSSRRKVADVVVSDDGLGSETVTLAGINVSAFELVGGELFLKAGTALDFETRAQLSVTVQVDDASIGATPDGTAILTLSIADANEAPSILIQNVTTSLAENSSTSIRRKVAGVLISDDALGRPVVTLTGADANRFELVGNELFLRSGVALDFETQSQFQVTVELDDPELGNTFESSAAMTLGLSDVNETPIVILTNAITSISEAADISTRRKVADIAVADDALGSETVTLAGINASAFELVGGELFLKAGTALDFETSAQLSVIVQVDDASIGATPDGTAIQTLRITDANEPPSIFLQNVTTTLAENTSTSNRRKVASVLITDDALGRPVVALTGADANRFELVGNELFLRSGVALDFETQSQFHVAVELDDPELGNVVESSAAMTLGLTDVNETPVVVLTNAIISISEATDTSSRRKVADVVVSDDGLGSETLTLTGTNAAAFELVGAELFLKAGTAIDFETLAQLSVTVQVDDATIGATPDGTSILALSIADANEAPSILLQNVTTNLAENTSTSNRRKLAGVLITDDALGRPAVTLAGADANRFELVGNELYLRSGVSLDFETQSQFQIIVELDDPELGSTFESSAAMTLGLTDVNESPVVALTNTLRLIPESLDTSINRRIADIVVTDDALGSESLGLAGADASLFEIVGNELYLSSGVELDFETRSRYVVSVVVDDTELGGPTDAVVEISVEISNANESPTELFLSNNQIQETTDTTVGPALIGKLQAIDDDRIGNSYEWSLASGIGADDNHRFRIDGNNLSLRQGESLSFLERPTHTIRVRVADGPHILERSFEIHVTDVNSSPTRIDLFPNAILENVDTSTSASLIGVLVAADDNQSARHTFTFANGAGSDHNDRFELSGAMLSLKQNVTVDFESTKEFAIRVAVFDGLNRYEQAILVPVVDVNEPPTLALFTTVTSLMENGDTSARRKLAEVIVTDDALGAETLTLSGMHADRFELVGNELFLKVGVPLNFEVLGQFLIAVHVDDSTTGGAIDGTSQFTLTITDLNEPPSLSLANVITSLPENSDTSTRRKLADIIVADDCARN